MRRIQGISDYVTTLDRAIKHHPVAGQHRWQTWRRVAKHQARGLVGSTYAHRWVGGSVLIVERSALGLTGNVYFGLHEYWDMCFLLDLLRPSDLFVDGGANAGSYTILAAKVCGSTVVAVEPGHEALGQLFGNIRANGIESKVKTVSMALSDHAGTANFELGTSTTNAVAVGDTGFVTGTITLDQLCHGKSPALIKLDLEGGEPAALRGAAAVLADPELLALLVEDHSPEVLAAIVAAGFEEYTYDPQTRSLSKGERRGNNAIWVRTARLDTVTERVRSAVGVRP